MFGRVLILMVIFIYLKLSNKLTKKHITNIIIKIQKILCMFRLILKPFSITKDNK